MSAFNGCKKMTLEEMMILSASGLITAEQRASVLETIAITLIDDCLHPDTSMHPSCGANVGYVRLQMQYLYRNESNKSAPSSEDRVVAKHLTNVFSRSRFIAERLLISPEETHAKFADRFKVEAGGVVVGYDERAEKIYSREKPGEVAEFDEALEILTWTHPDREKIVKAQPVQQKPVRLSGPTRIIN